MAEDPTNDIVLRWKMEDNPDIIHSDTVVLELLNTHQFELVMGYAEREIITDNGPVTISGPFDAAFIAWKPGLNLNLVALRVASVGCESEELHRSRRHGLQQPEACP